MTQGPPATIAFLGFGLIGGSIARALATDPGSGARIDRPRLVAWTPSGQGPTAAVRDGIIDRSAGSAGEALEGADLVVIAAPPIEAIGLVRRLATDLAPALHPAAVLTDVVSTKLAIMAEAATHGLSFVGGHPMAGRESSGYEAATGDLFVGRPWAIVASADGPAGAAHDVGAMVETVRWLALRCGARPMIMSAASHDAATAAVSHLPLIAAAALVEALAGLESEPLDVATALAASGWASATRLALGDPRMGAGILATNAPAITVHMRALRVALDAWLAALEAQGGPDADALEDRFAAARSSLTRMNDRIS